MKDWTIHLPSAGVNRFRFYGSARIASQPVVAPRGTVCLGVDVQDSKVSNCLRKPYILIAQAAASGYL